MEIDIVLQEPSTPGNVGAVARVMKNFGFENLVLISPECDHNSEEARARAMHAKDDVLSDAEVIEWDDLERYDYLVATTAMIGTDYNIKRSPVSPEEIGGRIAGIEGDVRIGVIFGREDVGLRNEEIMECDFVVTVLTHPEYPTMNLSHSVAIVLYELHRTVGEKGIGEGIKPIGKKEKDVLIGIIDDVLDDMEFQTEYKREQHKLLWRRIIGKSMLTNREAQALMGLFKKVK